MNIDNKLIKLNTIKIIDWDLDQQENMEEMLVEDTKENREIIKSINKDFNIEDNIMDDLINICKLGFEYADYWSPCQGFYRV